MNKKYCNICVYKGEYDGTPICKKGATLTDAINYVKEPYCPFSVKEDKTQTLEEVKKEWEDDGFKCREYETFITFINEIDKISFSFFYKRKGCDDLDCCEIENHSEEPLIITTKLHYRITKTFIALGHEV